MIGDEFKTARKFLLENLEGGIAWKDPVQAEKQKERLKAKKEKEESLRASEEAVQEEPIEEAEECQEPGSRVCSGRKCADSAAGNQPAGSTDGIIGGGQYKMAVSGRR